MNTLTTHCKENIQVLIEVHGVLGDAKGSPQTFLIVKSFIYNMVKVQNKQAKHQPAEQIFFFSIESSVFYYILILLD